MNEANWVTTVYIWLSLRSSWTSTLDLCSEIDKSVVEIWWDVVQWRSGVRTRHSTKLQRIVNAEYSWACQSSLSVASSSVSVPLTMVLIFLYCYSDFICHLHMWKSSPLNLALPPSSLSSDMLKKSRIQENTSVTEQCVGMAHNITFCKLNLLTSISLLHQSTWQTYIRFTQEIYFTKHNTIPLALKWCLQLTLGSDHQCPGSFFKHLLLSSLNILNLN